MLATQNPIEQEGTYPLPEAQLDRFHVQGRSALSVAGRNERSRQPHDPQEGRASLQKLIGPRILELRNVLDKVVVADPFRDFAVRLVLATHPASEFATEEMRKYVRWGASPRGRSR